MVDKAALLDAIAQAGTKGKQDYEQAQAALAAQQQEAIRMALAGSVAQGAPAGAQQEIQRIIGQPYQLRQAQMTQDDAARQDWFNRAGTSAGTFMGGVEGLIPAIDREYELKAALAAAGGGGGGSGGGGGGSDPGDWYKNLKDQFGTGELGFDAIAAEADALDLTKYKNSGLSPHDAIRKYAMETYGVPEGVALSKYTQSKDDKAIEAAARNLVEKGNAGKLSPRQVKKKLRQNNRANPGDQTYIRKAAVARLQQRRKKRR